MRGWVGGGGSGGFGGGQRGPRLWGVEGGAWGVLLQEGGGGRLPQPHTAVAAGRTPAGAPNPLLSLAAISSRYGGGGGGYASVAAGTGAQPPAAEPALRLMDIEPAADVERHLWQWQGQYSLSYEQPARTSAVLRFTKASAYKACSDALGGGVRGSFRVDRSYRPAAAAGGAGGGAAPAGGGGDGNGGGAQSSRWLTLTSAASGSARRNQPVVIGGDDPWGEDGNGGGGGGGLRGSLSAARAGQAAGGGEGDAAAGQAGEGVGGKHGELPQSNPWDVLSEEAA